MPKYEMVFVVQPQLEEDALAALLDRISQAVSDLNGTVLEVTPWGRRRLAYRIRNYRDGLYHLMQMELPSEAVRALGRSLKLMEDVIRHLIVRPDEQGTK
jgi:small subunit ribosomal protein S6